MSRTPSLDRAAAETMLGPRGSTTIRLENRSLARKWLVACGVSSVTASALSLNELSAIYNDASGVALNAILIGSGRMSAPNSGEANSMSDMVAIAGDTWPIRHALRDMGGRWNKDTRMWHVPRERHGDAIAMRDAHARTPATSPEAIAPAPQAAPAPSGMDAQRIASVVAAVLASMPQQSIDETAVRAIVEEYFPSNGEFASLIEETISRRLADLPVTRIEIARADGTVHNIEGNTHPKFTQLLMCAKARNSDGFVPGIFLKGEASSGKTFATKQLAEALGLSWHFNGAISFPHEMLGFIDGAGNYHRTPFREAYEHGGVYTFDEVDRSDPVALLAVNPHLANGIATFPDKQIKRHPDCIIIATANTWGHGANAEYSGATKLDAAFRSRFPRRIEWNIDESMERALSGNAAWARRVQSARAKARTAGLKVLIDTRMTYAGASLIANGMTETEAAELTYLSDLTPEQRNIVEAA